jgi:predicted TIM-barrel fold metal-dependent hydrolase
MSLRIIDPHLHFFNRNQGSYHWLTTGNPPFWPDKHILQRDFSLADLAFESSHTQLKNICTVDKSITLAGFVHIEAGFDNSKPWRELEYLQTLNADNSILLTSRTIASVNLLDTPKVFKQTLAKLQQYSSLIGVRHILDEQTLPILEAENSQLNLASLNDISDFIFELQLPLADKHVADIMPLLLKTLSQHQQLRFIINHAGFPPLVRSGSAGRQWQKNMAALANLNNVFVKCSGAEMVARDYQIQWFSEVVADCISLFSISRVMLASNFPLCLLSNKTYSKYWQDIVASPLIKQANTEQKNALLHDNALRIYQL